MLEVKALPPPQRSDFLHVTAALGSLQIGFHVGDVSERGRYLLPLAPRQSKRQDYELPGFMPSVLSLFLPSFY